MANYVVGSYATSPSGLPQNGPFDEAAERAFFAGLAALDTVGGLELAVFADGRLHPHDEDFLLGQLAEHGKAWRRVVLTCIPGTMGIMGESPHFGLASEDRAGRAAAVEFVSGVAEKVARVNTALHRAAFGVGAAPEGQSAGRVTAVEIHSAPTQGGDAKGSAARLKESLLELLAVDWSGARLVVEHCDAFVEAHPPQKGFLSLEQELEALTLTETQQTWLDGMGQPQPGIAINWARSVLETRDAATSVAHVRAAAAAGVLCGLMFSGCTDDEGAKGEIAAAYGAWTDSHMPAEGTVPGSLLTEAAVRECLAAAADVRGVYIGVKLLAAGAVADSVESRLGANAQLLGLIREADGR